MKALLVVLALLTGALPALAQDAAAAAKKRAPAAKPAASTAAEPATTAKPARARAAKSAAAKVALTGIKQSYESMPAAERAAIQSDLAWTGDYNGVLDGEFGERAIAAVKAFQKRNKSKETGILNPQERAALAAAAKPAQEHAGWRMVDDRASGARLGVPIKLASQSSPGKNGTRWSSAQGQIQIETFSLREPGMNLQTLLEQQKKDPPGRKVDYSVLRPDFIVLGGMQGLKKFYVRAHIKDGEVRGMTVLYDQATEGIMDPVVVAMSSAFAPFGGSSAAPAPMRPKVEYASGIVVTREGHIVTDRQATEECKTLVVGGLGNADRVADDAKAELALLRVHGARDLVPAALANSDTNATSLTLLGIADPQAQAGGSAVTTASARLGASNGGGRVIDPVPAAGYAGAAAVDPQGRLLGMVELKPTSVTGAGGGGSTPQPRAVVVPVETMRTFLQAQSLAPTSGAASLEAAKASVVRVICVRK